MSYDLVLGLGGCVDFEIAWDAEALGNLAVTHGIEASDLDTGILVEDERSLLCSMLAFVRDGVGGERFISSSDIVIAFASRFSCKATLGGTCVRAASAITRLGIPSLVHLVSIDDTVRRLLLPGIDHLSSATKDTLDPHLIVQFPAGAVVQLRDTTVRAEYPNRIIYANDPPNRDLVLSPELPEILAEARGFLVAGFNAMRDHALLLDRLAFLRQAMARISDDAVVFYEDAGFHDDAMRDIVGSNFRGRADVHSLNEDELQAYLARRIDLLDIDDVVAAIGEFERIAIAPTIVVHTKYWALAVGRRAAEFETALLGGIDLASTRYCYGDNFGLSEFAATQTIPPQPSGAAFALEIRDRLGDRIRCVPARLLNVPSPTTVGLGDTFVGGFLATAVYGTLLLPKEN